MLCFSCMSANPLNWMESSEAKSLKNSNERIRKRIRERIRERDSGDGDNHVIGHIIIQLGCFLEDGEQTTDFRVHMVHILC